MKIEQRSRVLVTGSAGVIGTELLTRLAARGATVLSIDRLPLVQPVPATTHLQQDLVDVDLGTLRAFRPDVLFHLAAAFERSLETPEFFSVNWHDNMVASHRIAELVADTRSLHRVVFASSYLIYDPALYIGPTPREQARRLSEDDPIRPRNLCGVAKLFAERELDFVGSDVSTVHARIYRVYGRGSRDVVSRWVRAALKGEELVVYNARNRFDYVFAADVAEGLLRLAESPAASGIVNLATGVGRAVGELVQALRYRFEGLAVCNMPDEPVYEASAACVDRLRGLLGWVPEVGLEEGLDALIAYERSRQR